MSEFPEDYIKARDDFCHGLGNNKFVRKYLKLAADFGYRYEGVETRKKFAKIAVIMSNMEEREKLLVDALKYIANNTDEIDQNCYCVDAGDALTKHKDLGGKQ